jgi:hypothetical protein
MPRSVPVQAAQMATVVPPRERLAEQAGALEQHVLRAPGALDAIVRGEPC